jgi:hypothetical protein
LTGHHCVREAQVSKQQGGKKVFIAHDNAFQRKCMMQFSIEVSYTAFPHIVKNGKQVYIYENKQNNGTEL